MVANDCEVFKQEIVEIVVYCARLRFAWCLVLRFGSLLFHSIPPVSAAEEFVCWLAGAVGGRTKISGVFWMWRCWLVLCSLLVLCFRRSLVRSFFLSFFVLLLLPRDSILFGQKCVSEVQV